MFFFLVLPSPKKVLDFRKNFEAKRPFANKREKFVKLLTRGGLSLGNAQKSVSLRPGAWQIISMKQKSEI